jgi:hypothetical protein
MKAGVAKAAAIAAGAIPLREAAPGSGAEELNAHGDTNRAAREFVMREQGQRPASESGRYKGVLEELQLGVGV